VVPDPTRIYIVGCSVSLAGLSNCTLPDLDRPKVWFVADQARLLNNAENITVLPCNRRFRSHQTNKHRRYMSRVARVCRRGLESYSRHYSPMEGFIQASHIVKINLESTSDQIWNHLHISKQCRRRAVALFFAKQPKSGTCKYPTNFRASPKNKSSKLIL